MRTRYALALSLFGSLVVAGDASGQPQPSPCVQNPAAAESDQSQQIDDCHGALKPPEVRENQIVEPTPEGADIPDQQSETGQVGGSNSGTQNGRDYSISAIADAIGRSAETARRLRSIEPANVVIRDISILAGGSNAAVLNASAAAHAGAVDELRAVIQSRPALATAVSASGLSVTGIVAAEIDGDGIVTLFGR